MKHFVLQFSIGVVILFLFAACAPSPSKTQSRQFISLSQPTVTPSIALNVNGIPILKETVDTQREMLRPIAEKTGVSQNIDALVIDTLIDRALIEKTADTLGVQNVSTVEKITNMQQDIPAEIFAAWLEKNNLSAADFEQVVRAELETKAVFDAVTAAVPQTATQIHARCLHFIDESAAQSARQQLAEGASFTSLAVKNSCTAESAPHGGDLGWFPAGIGVLPTDVEQIAFTMQSESTSEILVSDAGFFIVRVESRADNRPLTPEYHYQLRVLAFQQWLAHQRASANIERIAN